MGERLGLGDELRRDGLVVARGRSEIEQRERACDADAGKRRDSRREAEGVLAQAVGGNGLLREPDAHRLVSSDRRPGEHQPAGAAGADEARQRPGQPARRAEPDVEVTDPQTGVLGDDAQVAHAGELEASRDRVPVHGSDHRAAKAVDRLAEQAVAIEIAREGSRILPRELAEVGARAERGPGTCEHDAAAAVVGRKRAERREQLVE